MRRAGGREGALGQARARAEARQTAIRGKGLRIDLFSVVSMDKTADDRRSRYRRTPSYRAKSPCRCRDWTRDGKIRLVGARSFVGAGRKVNSLLPVQNSLKRHMSDAGSDRSSSSSHNMRQSLARGAALAARDAAERNRAQSEEAAKLEAAKALAEKRKSYGRVQKRVASPAGSKGAVKRPPSPAARPPSPARKDSDRGGSASSVVPALRKASPDGKKRGPTPQGTPHKGGARKRPVGGGPPLAPSARAATAPSARAATAFAPATATATAATEEEEEEEGVKAPLGLGARDRDELAK